MSVGMLLVIGKAVLWFAIPLGFAVWQLRQLRREDRGR